MAAGTPKYELIPPLYWWAASPGTDTYGIRWGGVEVVPSGSPASTISTSVTAGTFYRGAYSGYSTPSSDYYFVSKEQNPIAPGTLIYGADYNAVQVKVGGILGDGTYYGGPTNGYGYGQTVTSSVVSPTNTITAAQWDNLVSDLNKIIVHQFSSTSTVLTTATSLANPGLPVVYEALEIAEAIAAGAVTNRTSLGTGQITYDYNFYQRWVDFDWGGSDATPTDPGGTSQTVFTPSIVDSTFEIQFSSQADLHYFFNAGGQVYVLGRRDSGGLTPYSDQEQAWYDLMGTWNNTLIGRAQVATMLAAGAGNPVTLASFNSSTTPYTGASVFIIGTYNTNKITVKVEFSDGHVPTELGPDFIRANLVGYTLHRYLVTGAYNGGFDSVVPTFVEIETFA
jgi:hypothetical protein